MIPKIPGGILSLALVLALLPGCDNSAAAGPDSELERGFSQPPEQTKPWVYWYWISDNISKEGITRDLEAMARAGIGEAFIGNVDVNPDSRGGTKVLTEPWWKMVDHAIREGGRLGVRLGGHQGWIAAVAGARRERIPEPSRRVRPNARVGRISEPNARISKSANRDGRSC